MTKLQGPFYLSGISTPDEFSVLRSTAEPIHIQNVLKVWKSPIAMCCLALRQVTSKQIIQSMEPGQQVASGDYSKEVKLEKKVFIRLKQVSFLYIPSRRLARCFTLSLGCQMQGNTLHWLESFSCHVTSTQLYDLFLAVSIFSYVFLWLYIGEWAVDIKVSVCVCVLLTLSLCSGASVVLEKVLWEQRGKAPLPSGFSAW